MFELVKPCIYKDNQKRIYLKVVEKNLIKIINGGDWLISHYQ
jgi:hypothetical protein